MKFEKSEIFFSVKNRLDRRFFDMEKAGKVFAVDNFVTIM